MITFSLTSTTVFGSKTGHKPPIFVFLAFWASFLSSVITLYSKDTENLFLKAFYNSFFPSHTVSSVNDQSRQIHNFSLFWSEENVQGNSGNPNWRVDFLAWYCEQFLPFSVILCRFLRSPVLIGGKFTNSLILELEKLLRYFWNSQMKGRRYGWVLWAIFVIFSVSLVVFGGLQPVTVVNFQLP